MPFNGSGVFQRVRSWVADATAGIKIRADYHDSEDDGFAAGLSNCITKDGQTVVTENIPMNNKRLTGLEDPVNPQDAATRKYVLDTKAAGGEQTGGIVIKNATPNLTLNSTAVDASGQMQIVGQRNGLARWLLRLGNGAIEGADPAVANEGSDFDIYRADDAGAYIGSVLNINRTTGLGVVAGNPTADLGIATKGYVDSVDATRMPYAGGSFTGPVITATAVQGISGAGGMGTIEVRGGQPGITFHSEGAFATNFGMDVNGNFYMGGWSHGATAYRFWTTKDFASFPTNFVTATRLSYAGDPGVGFTSAGVVAEPYPGAVATGWEWTAIPAPLITKVRMRYLQYWTQDQGWVTSGYA